MKRKEVHIFGKGGNMLGSKGDGLWTVQVFLGGGPERGEREWHIETVWSTRADAEGGWGSCLGMWIGRGGGEWVLAGLVAR